MTRSVKCGVDQKMGECQVMAQRRRATRRAPLKPFAFLGLLHCAECGAMITAKIQKGHTYYHCTKRKEPCSQPYVRGNLGQLQSARSKSFFER